MTHISNSSKNAEEKAGENLVAEFLDLFFSSPTTRITDLEGQINTGDLRTGSGACVEVKTQRITPEQGGRFTSNVIEVAMFRPEVKSYHQGGVSTLADALGLPAEVVAAKKVRDRKTGNVFFLGEVEDGRLQASIKSWLGAELIIYTNHTTGMLCLYTRAEGLNVVRDAFLSPAPFLMNVNSNVSEGTITFFAPYSPRLFRRFNGVWHAKFEYDWAQTATILGGVAPHLAVLAA